MVLGNRGRGLQGRIFHPLAAVLVRWHVPADAVTFVGTVVTAAAALALFPTAHLAAGALVVGLFVALDSVDGIMARMVQPERPRPYGEFLDSTLDRFADGAIFAGLALYFVSHTAGAIRLWGVAGAVGCVALGGLVSYARAKAQALGVVAKVGIAERADRIIAALVATLAVGLGAPVVVMVVMLALLCVASLITVAQRIAVVRRSLAPELPGPTA